MANLTERDENPPPNNLWGWMLNNASNLRDLALAGAAGTYVLGFIIWSIHAWRNDLGLLPVIDSQYIIAGLLPMALLGLAVVPVYILIKRISVGVNVILIAGVPAVLMILFYVAKNTFLDASYALTETVSSILSYISGMIVLIYGVSWSATRARSYGQQSGRSILVFYFLFYLFWLGAMIMAINQYASVIYPNIPHPLGGARPRCAYLDVDIDKISADSKSILFSTNGDTSTTRRSVELKVYCAGDNWVLVKKVLIRAARGSDIYDIDKILPIELRESDTYEIDRDAINAIIWC